MCFYWRIWIVPSLHFSRLASSNEKWCHIYFLLQYFILKANLFTNLGFSKAICNFLWSFQNLFIFYFIRNEIVVFPNLLHSCYKSRQQTWIIMSIKCFGLNCQWAAGSRISAFKALQNKVNCSKDGNLKKVIVNKCDAKL